MHAIELLNKGFEPVREKICEVKQRGNVKGHALLTKAGRLYVAAVYEVTRKGKTVLIYGDPLLFFNFRVVKRRKLERVLGTYDILTIDGVPVKESELLDEVLRV